VKVVYYILNFFQFFAQRLFQKGYRNIE